MSAAAFVFLTIDKPSRLSCRPFLLINIQSFHNALEQANLIIAIKDLEILWQLGFRPMHAQQSVRQTVEGAYPHGACRHIEQTFSARTQFCRGFVSKRYCKNAVRRDTFDLNQPRNTVNEYPGFTAARTGND